MNNEHTKAFILRKRINNVEKKKIIERKNRIEKFNLYDEITLMAWTNQAIENAWVQCSKTFICFAITIIIIIISIISIQMCSLQTNKYTILTRRIWNNWYFSLFCIVFCTMLRYMAFSNNWQLALLTLASKLLKSVWFYICNELTSCLCVHTAQTEHQIVYKIRHIEFVFMSFDLWSVLDWRQSQQKASNFKTSAFFVWPCDFFHPKVSIWCLVTEQKFIYKKVKFRAFNSSISFFVSISRENRNLRFVFLFYEQKTFQHPNKLTNWRMGRKKNTVNKMYLMHACMHRITKKKKKKKRY